MRYCDGLSVPEAPVVLNDGSLIVVEMGSERGCITHITNGGNDKRIIAKTGRPNGLAIDAEQNIWCAESKRPSLLKVTMSGTIEVISTACGSEPFLFPNDLAFGPDGRLYFTDSGILFEDFAPGGKVRPDYNEVPMDGRVYAVDVRDRRIEKLDSGLRFSNGIAFGPDRNLYVNEMITGNIYRYDFANGKTGPRQYFGNVIAEGAPAGIKGPDGMKFGRNGDLFVAVFAQGDVTVLGADGRVIRRIKTDGIFPTNVAFDLPGKRRVYVTEDEKGTLEVFDTDCDGLPLCDGARN